jgi:iron(III) transport system permease protein
MRGGSAFRWLGPLGWSAYLAVGYGPLLAALMAAATEAPDPAWQALSSRRLGLLLKSLSFSGSVAVGVILLGTLAAVWLLRHRLTARAGLQWLLLSSVAVPPTVQALAWCQLLGALGSLTGLSLIGDWGTAAVVQGLSLLPFGTGLAMAALQSCDGLLLDAGRIQADPLRLIRRLALPLARPLLVSAAVLTYLLSLLDYTIPSILGVNVYAMEVFVSFSANHSVREAFGLSLPVVALSLVLLERLARLPKRLAQKPASPFPRDGVLPRFAVRLCGAAALAAGFTLLLPWLSLLGAFNDPAVLVGTVGRSSAELSSSLGISLVATLLALALAILPAWSLAFARGGRAGLWALALLPYLLPPTLSAIGLIALRIQAAAGLDGSIWPLIVALASRLAPLALAVLAAFLLRLDPSLIEAALVSCRTRRQATVRILLPLVLPGLLAAGSLVFVLSLGDVGTTLLLLPPGVESLAIKTYNYLHYGGSQAAAGLCLMLLTLAIAGGAVRWTLRWLLRAWQRQLRHRGGWG